MSGGWICGIGVSPFAFAASEDRAERGEREMEDDRSALLFSRLRQRAKRWIVIGSESESPSFRGSKPQSFPSSRNFAKGCRENVQIEYPRIGTSNLLFRPSNKSPIPTFLCPPSSPSRHWRPTAKPRFSPKGYFTTRPSLTPTLARGRRGGWGAHKTIPPPPQRTSLRRPPWPPTRSSSSSSLELLSLCR